MNKIVTKAALSLAGLAAFATVAAPAPASAAVSADWFGNNHASVHSVVVARGYNGDGVDHIIKPGGFFWGMKSFYLPLGCKGVMNRSDRGYWPQTVYGGRWYNAKALQVIVRVKSCNFRD